MILHRSIIAKHHERNPRITRRRRAFTLIEVLATMVLLAIVIPVCMRAISLAIAAASSARHNSEAASLAQEKLNEIVLTGIGSAATSGDFAPDHPDYKWNLETQSRDYSLTEADLTVTWIERGQQHSMLVSTLVSDSASGTSSSSIGGATP